MAIRVGGLNVSRETYDKMRHFEALVEKWTKKINLIAPGTVQSIWDRHIQDSVQIYQYAPGKTRTWCDLGSGGGFPGLAIAILGQDRSEPLSVTLIESDQRKATFLRTAARELTLNAKIICDRIEVADPQNADIVSARALAPLSGLFPYIQRHVSPDGLALLHKGRHYLSETAEAGKSWFFDLEEHPSLTDPEARILAIKGITSLG